MKTSWIVIAVAVLVIALPGSKLSAETRGQASRGIVAMEFANDDVHGQRSFLAHGREMTHLHPRWLHLAQPWTGQVDEDIDSDILAAASAFGVSVIPMLDNFDGAQAQPDVVRRVLTSPEQRASFIQALSSLIVARGFGGVEVDFLGLTPADESLLATFLTELSAALKPGGGILVLSEYVDPADVARIRELGNLATRVDFVRVRIAGETTPFSPPGPSASRQFFDASLAAVTQAIPREKLIVDMSLMGLDWSGTGPASEIWFGRAMALANARRGSVEWDSQTDSLVLTYTEGGVAHQAYFEDSLTLNNKVRKVESQGLAGVSFNRLGFEYPTLWTMLSRRGATDAADRLSVAKAPPFEVIGAGEVWAVANAEERDGRREFISDPTNGLISAIRYSEPPAPRILDLTGVPADGKQIAITFDDGPSREWTPRVLDLLSELQVPATFFVVGRHALGNRDLIRRMFNEGHELGSHTFSHIALLEMSPPQTIFELNATKYVVAGITGRTMLFFRSPFVANPNPRDEGLGETPGYFLLPQLRAREFGYLTVGNNLDPRDWERPGVAQIFTAATNRSLDPPGYVMLLHDSGGDRTQTLRALPLIVDFYRSEGFRFTTVSGLLG